MPSDDLRNRADRRFDGALAATGARDPRDFYRELLRELRERDEPSYRRARDYFNTRLVPAVADEASDPLAEWLDYGRFLAELIRAGQTVQIDPSGRAEPYGSPVPGDHLVLHLPDSGREKALPIGLPPELSPAQRAAYDLLVRHATG